MRNLHLPASIVSSSDVTALELEVKSYAKWFTHNSIKASVNAPSGTGAPQISAVTIEVIKQWVGTDRLDQQCLDELIASLEAFKQSAPVLTITLAAPAGNDVKQSVIVWCRENIAGNALISFHFNRALLGGMVLRYGSHVYDWSFRRKLLDIKGGFTEVLSHV